MAVDRADRDTASRNKSHADDQDVAQQAALDTGPAGDAAVKRMAKGGATVDLGKFNGENPPGAKLGGMIQKMKPGDSVSFEVAGNQIYNVVDFKVGPHITVDKKLVKAMNHGQLGDSNDYRYTFTMAHDAKPGAKSTCTSEPSYQSRNDPNWHFHFTLEAE
jgi:hypothetical protein